MIKFNGKVAIVTGASRGIGRSISVALAKAGAMVVVTARTERPGKIPGTIHETAETIRSLGGTALALRCDVSNENDVAEMFARTVEKFGRVDILINNAAVGLYTPFLAIPTKHFDLVYRVNVRGPFLCIKAVLPHMIARKSGAIVNISSSAAENMFSLLTRAGGVRRTSGVAYGASKAALERMTRGVAEEVREYNIAVNALKPSTPVISEGVRVWNPDVDESQFVESDRFMTPAALFLASQDAKGITGGVFYDGELCREYGLSS
jgi:citronellol/citronellal dehydrogenase